jgi:hypothetical protein
MQNNNQLNIEKNFLNQIDLDEGFNYSNYC